MARTVAADSDRTDGESVVSNVFFSLGSINADFQMKVPSEIGDIETQIANGFARLSGGKATNRAFLARRFGCAVKLLGRVGDDELARQALGDLGADGVDLTGVTVAADTSTAVSVIIVPPSAKKRIFLATNANACWSAEAGNMLETTIKQAGSGSILSVDYETTADIVERALHVAGKAKIRVVIDPSPANRVPARAIGQATAIAPNVEEVEGLIGVQARDDHSAARAATELVKAGTALACVKLEDGGAIIAHRDGVVAIPPTGNTAVDATGAGDAFTGALAIGILEGRPWLDCGCLAVAAASMAVTCFGSQHHNLDPRLIKPLATQLKERVRSIPV
jgi:ribokinase